MMVLTACGAEDKKTEEVSVNIESEAAEDSRKDAEDKEEVEVSGNLKADMTDFVLGEDILFNKKSSFSFEIFPETHILLPSDDVTEITKEGSSEYKRFYEITLKGGQKILLTTEVSGHKEDHCGVKHIDRLELGNYAIDYSWCSVAVEDYKNNTAFSLLFSYVEYEDNRDYASEFKEFITDLTKENVDYLEEQVSEWDDDFVPPATEDAAATEVPDESAEEVVNTQKYVDVHNSTIIIEYFSDEKAALTAEDASGYDYALELNHIDGDVWQAVDPEKPDEIALTITFVANGLSCDTEYDYYSNLYGDYMLIN